MLEEMKYNEDFKKFMHFLIIYEQDEINIIHLISPKKKSFINLK